jgi:hypothetical protein
MKEVRIRYRTETGVVGVWPVPFASIRNDSDDACRAYLKHWHANYEYLGKDDGTFADDAPRPAVEDDEQDVNDASVASVIAAVLDELPSSVSTDSSEAAPDTSSDISSDTSSGFDGGSDGGGGGGADF